MTTTLKFYYNGIKDNGGKLQGCYYSYGSLYPNTDAATITIYAYKYQRFSIAIQELFDVLNDSDSRSDYFEADHFRVFPSHPLYADVLVAYNKSRARCKARNAAWVTRMIVKVFPLLTIFVPL